MGYRSDVVLSVRNDMLKESINKIDDNSLKQRVVKLFQEADYHEKKDGWSYYRWNWIKWYKSTFWEIAWLACEINMWEQEHFRFVRLGEDFTDIEDEGLGENDPFEVSISLDVVSSLDNW